MNIHQAKTQLSKLIEAALADEDVVIAKAGKPVVKLTAYKEKKVTRKPGLWKGKVFIPDNFDDEDEEFNKLFYEGEIFPKEADEK
jgi:prevent-host-death family protein